MLTRLGDLVGAEAVYDETLIQVGYIRGRAVYPVGGMAIVALARGEVARAAQIVGALEAYQIPLLPAVRPLYDALVVQVHAYLKLPEVRSAWERGQQMELEALVAYARRQDTQPI